MKFIAFEGLDGAGKSTLIEALAQELKAQGEKAILTREPGGSQLGNKIRELLLSVKDEAPCPRAELFLYEADRAQHVDLIIHPALARGEWVISDRYYASTTAFQVGGRGLDADEVNELNQFATNGLEPDLWVLLDLTTEEAKRRMQGRELDRFERENSEFHERVRQSYLKQVRENESEWLVIDASFDREKMKAMLFENLRTRGWMK